MKRWRVIVVITVLVSMVIMTVSAVFFDQAWWRYPWGYLTVVRAPHRVWQIAMFEDASVRVSLAVMMATFVTQFLLGVLVLYIVPRRVGYMARAIGSGWKPLVRYFTVGLLISVTIAAVGLLSILAVHTMPLPFILASIFFLAFLIGLAAIAYQLGRSLLTRAAWADGSPLVPLALGMLVISALVRIPYFGGIALVSLLVTGVGLAIATRFGSGVSWSLQPLMEDPQV